MPPGKPEDTPTGPRLVREGGAVCGVSIMSTPATGVQEWWAIPWPQVERDVHALQRRIYRASQKGDRRKVHRLQRLLMSSWSAKCLAVRQVTQDNQGKRTAGVDGISALEPEERMDLTF